MTKMYSFRHGIVDVGVYEEKFLSFEDMTGLKVVFYHDGKWSPRDKHPTLISIGEAEKRNLVRMKNVTSEPRRIKFKTILLSDGEDKTREVYEITRNKYTTPEQFLGKDSAVTFFVSFVDDQLNECDPPQLTIEWEECER